MTLWLQVVQPFTRRPSTKMDVNPPSDVAQSYTSSDITAGAYGVVDKEHVVDMLIFLMEGKHKLLMRVAIFPSQSTSR